jgi:hypothetical protein
MVTLDEDKKPNPFNPSNWNQTYKPGDDKQKHAFAGFAIALAVFVFLTETFKVSKVKVFIACAVVAVLVAVGAMFGKESFWDGYLGQGFPDVWDFWCGLSLLPLVIIIIAIYGYILWKKGALK